MALKNPKLTVKVLQSLLTRIGSASSGAKATLQERFQHDIGISRLFAHHSEWQSRRGKDWNRKLRIVSIDMGIKNLAFCDVDVEYPLSGSLDATMNILRWEKIDLVKTTPVPQNHAQSPRGIKEEAIENDKDIDPYSLPMLSATAYSLVKKTILTSAPDIILIEKQRWRSDGGSAVLQWTVRVNTLEAMLWAVLETLRSERRALLPSQNETDETRDYEIFAVDPKRVGPYWLAQAASSGKITVSDEVTEEQDGETPKKKVSRSKAQKKARIALLRSWLASTPASTMPSTPKKTPTITFNIGRGAELSRRALCFPSKPTRRSKKSKAGNGDQIEGNTEAEIPDSEIKKLDDITDCFLQAAAWVSWESNRLQLQDVRNRARKDDRSMPDISEKMMLEMVKEVGG